MEGDTIVLSSIAAMAGISDSAISLHIRLLKDFGSFLLFKNLRKKTILCDFEPHVVHSNLIRVKYNKVECNNTILYKNFLSNILV